MLILVAVSVSVALNGGLFNKAKTASDDTKEAVIREQLQDIILGNLDVNNNTIPEELGSITLDGVTYSITAAEGTADAETGEKPITITLTATGKEPIDYDLKSYVKVGGVKGVTNNDKPETIAYYFGQDGEEEYALKIVKENNVDKEYILARTNERLGNRRGYYNRRKCRIFWNTCSL